MELDSFKSILLRKAEGNSELYSLIDKLGEDILITSVVDALEKMAKPTDRTGLNANSAVTDFGAALDTTDTNQLRDALGHHLSHYKAALKAHHAASEGPEKTKMRQVADKHLEHVIPLMHLTARAAHHSGGKLSIDYPPLAPWETNYTTLHRSENNPKRFLRDAKLLAARPTKDRKRTDRDPALAAPAPGEKRKPVTTISDYHYLEMPPHPGHDAVSTMPHSSGYPWEEIQVGSPANIDAKKAYLHIDDIPDKKEYTPHEFDSHPIRSVADIQQEHFTPEAQQAHADAIKNWRGSDQHKKWLNRHRDIFTADKEAYKQRGQSKGSHFYEGVPLQEHPSHVHDFPQKPKYQPPVTARSQASAQGSNEPVNADKLPPLLRRFAESGTKSEAQKTKSGSALNVAALPPLLRRLAPGSTAAPGTATPSKSQASPVAVQTSVQPETAAAPHRWEPTYQVWKQLPKEQQEEMLMMPSFKQYVESKGGK
jgi:hypothetical protein